MDDLKTSETTEASPETFVGLTPQENALLNCVSLDDLSEAERELPVTERRERCAEIMQEKLTLIRSKYSDNPFALECIDRYDPLSEYRELTNKSIEADKAGDTELADEIQKQIDEKYPLLYMWRKANNFKVV